MREGAVLILRVSKAHTEKGTKLWKVRLTLRRSPRARRGQDKEKRPHCTTPTPNPTERAAASRQRPR